MRRHLFHQPGPRGGEQPGLPVALGAGEEAEARYAVLVGAATEFLDAFVRADAAACERIGKGEGWLEVDSLTVLPRQGNPAAGR